MTVTADILPVPGCGVSPRSAAELAKVRWKDWRRRDPQRGPLTPYRAAGSRSSFTMGLAAPSFSVGVRRADAELVMNSPLNDLHIEPPRSKEARRRRVSWFR